MATRRGGDQQHMDLMRGLKEQLPEVALVEGPGRGLFASDGAIGHQDLPAAVVLPSCERELVLALRFCHEQGVDAVIRGAGTSLSGGAVGGRQSIVIATTRLNRIIAVDRRGRRIRAEAGAMLTRVAAAAAAVGLWLPQAPRTPSPATLGGAIAKDVGGASGARYGSIANRVTGLRLVLADGEVLELGEGELDCGGYDIGGLIAGSEGVLAAISEATLDLVPAPEATQLMVASFADAIAAARVAAALASDDVAPAVLELVDAGMLASAGDHFATEGVGAGGAVLLIEVDGNPEDVAEAGDRIRARLAEHGTRRTDEIEEAGLAERIWRARETVQARLRRRGQTGDCDITVPVGDLAAALARLGEIAREAGVAVVHLARAGEGRVQSVFVAEDGAADGAVRVAEALDQVARFAGETGALAIGELGAGVIRTVDVGAGGIGAADLAMQQRLKTVFDGNWTMNRGKVLPAEG